MIKNIIFDIGAVLVDGNLHHYYRQMMKDDSEVEKFLNEICSYEWRHSLDLGRPWEDARSELVSKYPEYTHCIDAYWHEIICVPIQGSIEILKDLKRKGFSIYALSNWNHITFQVALQEFGFLNLFDGRIVSGEVKIAKPDPRIYQLLLDTYQLIPEESLFIDDRLENVEAARCLGIKSIQFVSPQDLEKDLTHHGVYKKKA